MKYAQVYALLLFFVFITACGQNQTNSAKVNTRSERKDSATSPGSIENYHTKYEYTDLNGKNLIIENSFPRGEVYTDPNGNEYAKAIFWTRVINETDSPLELTIHFSGDPYEFPASVGSSINGYFKIILPFDTITRDKEDLHNYGRTDLDSFFVNRIDKPSSLKRTIYPNKSSGFYVVRLLIKPKSGWENVKRDSNIRQNSKYGTTRAGFRLKGQNVFYTLNGKEIHCGSINFQNLRSR